MNHSDVALAPTNSDTSGHPMKRLAPIESIDLDDMGSYVKRCALSWQPILFRADKHRRMPTRACAPRSYPPPNGPSTCAEKECSYSGSFADLVFKLDEITSRVQVSPYDLLKTPRMKVAYLPSTTSARKNLGRLTGTLQKSLGENSHYQPWISGDYSI
jgi:hypothetical protein